MFAIWIFFMVFIKEDLAGSEVDSCENERKSWDSECPGLCALLEKHQPSEYIIGSFRAIHIIVLISFVVLLFLAIFQRGILNGCVRMLKHENQIGKRKRKRSRRRSDKRIKTSSVQKQQIQIPAESPIIKQQPKTPIQENVPSPVPAHVSDPAPAPAPVPKTPKVDPVILKHQKYVARRQKENETDVKSSNFRKMGSIFIPQDVEDIAFAPRSPPKSVKIEKVVYAQSLNETFDIGTYVDDVEYAPSTVPSGMEELPVSDRREPAKKDDSVFVEEKDKKVKNVEVATAKVAKKFSEEATARE